MVQFTPIRERVFRALDAAIENGYEVGETRAEAQELLDKDADLEGEDLSVVADCVAQWKGERGLDLHRAVEAAAPDWRRAAFAEFAPDRPPVYVAGLAFDSELESEQDDPSVKSADLVDLAWPTAAAAGLVFADVLDRAQAAALKEFKDLNEEPGATCSIEWFAHFESKTGKDGETHHRCKGRATVKFDGDEPQFEYVFVVIRSM